MESINPETMDSPISADDITDEQLEELVRLISKKRNRNKPCICRSGKKLKHCCLGKVKALQQQMKESL
ncbi:SEC-C metal-binding domain-containing protein [Vibrio cholerae]|uniref:SEC-C metal-binding domain-containing protein n=1 Tax=Vibrio cholerae TaxID=666 RepID=UPI0029344E20|nr:SEC-C metal-binding domain-containing protein [Vibrio cholerae]MDV2356945.1 SEC-C metal-binding domain-containing protein [Vibrio cholerae]MDV2378160.1 SEC-C metal-binding domain-containing protein [Vibrio cholerae]HBN6942011.1 SEC-C domain-containing protein [Vibrio cholerae]